MAFPHKSAQYPNLAKVVTLPAAPVEPAANTRRRRKRRA
jgi:hypothetical protein